MDEVSPWQRMFLNVQFYLKTRALLAPALREGGSVWTDGDEQSISALLIVPREAIVEVRLEGPRWWEPNHAAHAADLANELAEALYERWQEMIE